LELERTARALRGDRIPKTRQTNEIDWKMDTEVVTSNAGLGIRSIPRGDIGQRRVPRPAVVKAHLRVRVLLLESVHNQEGRVVSYLKVRLYRFCGLVSSHRVSQRLYEV
jgi:hypothetical protein